MLIRTMLILCATGLMACDSDNPSGTDTNQVLTPDVVDTTSSDTSVDTSPEVVEDTSAPDTRAPDTTAPDTTAPDTADTTAPDTTDTNEMPDTVDTVDTTPETDASAGACDNTGDFNTLAGLQSTLESKIQTCAFSCLGQGAACAATCIERETALSTGCSACFGEIIACTISNCALQCLDASSQGCTTCRDTNCTPAFEACAGIEQP